MRPIRLTSLIALGAGAVLVLSACGSSSSSAPEPAPNDSGDAAAVTCATVDKAGTDELAKVCAAGKIIVSTDPAYPPQSKLDPETNEYEGFDIDVANEIAKRLGVTTEWIAPSWDVITAGGWNGRWDMSVGSMSVTEERAKVLNFTPAYYFTPASIAVNKANTTITNLETDVDGKKVGACLACTYESYLKKTLAIPGYTFNFVIDDAKVSGVRHRHDRPAGPCARRRHPPRRRDVVAHGLQGAIDSGKPIKVVGDPLFYEPLAVAFDKSSTRTTALAAGRRARSSRRCTRTAR